MHSNQGVNPLHPITKEMKKYTVGLWILG
jgi:hypothetical protein